MVARTIYDTLTRPNAEGEYVPYLAEAVEPNDDSTQWTIKLREGVKFHDGTDLDRRGREEQPRRLPRRTYPAPRPPLLFIFVFEHIESVEVVDPLTVQVNDEAAVGRLPAACSTAAAASGSWPRPSSTTRRRCAENLIGTGPFKLDAEWVVQPELHRGEEPRLLARTPTASSSRTSTRSTFRPDHRGGPAA